MARQHAVRARRGSRDPDRLLRHLESGPAEDDLPTRSRLPVRPCDAGDRGRALQLFPAGRTLAGLPSARRSARAGPGVSVVRAHGARAQLPAPRVARELPVRRVAGAVQVVQARRARALDRARSRHVARAVRDLAADERLGLSQQDAGTPRDLSELGGANTSRRSRPPSRRSSLATRRSASSSTASSASSTRTFCRSRTSTTARSVRSRARRRITGRSSRCVCQASNTSRFVRSI